jgi:response regulator RpfG family c-di-GMP phosphodiesterase
MTITTEQPVLEVVRRSFVAAASAALADTFGVAFDLWIWQNDRWQCLSADEPGGECLSEHGQSQSDVAAILGQLPDNVCKPKLVGRGDDRHLLLVPIRPNDRTTVVAAATVQTTEPGLLVQLAQFFLKDFQRREQLERLHDENTAFALQVTDDFEELMFLRRMAEFLDVSESFHDFGQMAEAVLPLLIHSVKAELLVIVAAEPSSESADTGEFQVGSVIARCGHKVLDDDICQRIVARYHGDAEVQPVVKNRFDDSEEGTDCPGVREFVLTPLAKNGEVKAWLLALNRRAGSGYSGFECQWQASDLEFGTGEASLLSSAAAMLATHAKNVELFREKEQLLTNMVRALVYAIEAKDQYTCGHSERVALYGRRLAEELGLDEQACERLYLTGLLHDVGKIGVPDATLLKPDRLTDDEFTQIKQHPDSGWAILQDLNQLRYVLPGVLYHHERYDGKGYPDQLTGEDIPLDGRILAVADAFDAMTSDRPYRKGMPQEKAESILRQGTTTQWDPRVIDAFFRAVPDIIRIHETYQQRAHPVRQAKNVLPLKSALAT